MCAAHGRSVRFVTFLRYGVPATLCQMVMAAGYVWVLSLVG